MTGRSAPPFIELLSFARRLGPTWLYVPFESDFDRWRKITTRERTRGARNVSWLQDEREISALVNDEWRVHRDGWYTVYLVSRYRGYHLLIKLFGIRGGAE